MESPARYDVKTRDGRLLASLYLNPKEGIMLERKTDAGGGEKKYENKDRKRSYGGSPNSAEPMTYAQKRFLFRIITQQGKGGKEAPEYLKQLFQVKSLDDVTKFEASRMIEQLLKEEKQEKGDDGGIPF